MEWFMILGIVCLFAAIPLASVVALLLVVHGLRGRVRDLEEMVTDLSQHLKGG